MLLEPRPNQRSNVAYLTQVSRPVEINGVTHVRSQQDWKNSTVFINTLFYPSTVFRLSKKLDVFKTAVKAIKLQTFSIPSSWFL